MASQLICSETQSRVSSVLNRDVKQFGKKFMFDCNEETCWNSDQGDRQWVLLEFPQSVKVSEVKLQFQGGFSAKACRLEGKRCGFLKEVIAILTLDFPIQEAPTVDKVKILFENSTDLFGRIVVYSLDILGEKTS
uniref:Nuclear receptor 2C2-associated protein n=1 Tax=Poecilia mexicana TaxID=48701 RepID=A0A3B3Z504_9TELE